MIIKATTELFHNILSFVCCVSCRHSSNTSSRMCVVKHSSSTSVSLDLKALYKSIIIIFCCCYFIIILIIIIIIIIIINWSARKHHLHLQSVARISHHSASSEDSIRQCETATVASSMSIVAMMG